MKIFKLSLILLLVAIQTPVGAQTPDEENNRRVDNNLSFKVISEKVHTRGMMKVCITDTSNECIQNLQSGFVVKVYDQKGEVLWAGKTAGREQMLRFPKPMKEAAWVTMTAFKPFVLNTYTGTRIYQDKPIETKYMLIDE